MTPDALNFTGDAVTYLGLIGVISTAIIVVSVFRSYFNSPLRKWWPTKNFSINYNNSTKNN